MVVKKLGIYIISSVHSADACGNQVDVLTFGWKMIVENKYAPYIEHFLARIGGPPGSGHAQDLTPPPFIHKKKMTILYIRRNLSPILSTYIGVNRKIKDNST